MKNIIILFIPIVLLITNSNCSQSTEPISDEEGGYILTQIDPQFSFDNKMIVFKGRYDSIYAVHFIDTSGNYLGYILKDNGYLNSPTWAPDNNRLAVSIEGSIFIVNKDGTNLSRIINSDQDFFCNWSPDGNYIAFTKSICDPECGIALYNMNDYTSKVIGQYGSYASWSMDSKKIYYCTYHYDNKGKYLGLVIRKINIETNVEDSLIYVNNEKLYLEDCIVSPNEKEFLFAASYGPPPTINIWKIDLQAKSMIELTFDGGSCPSYNSAGNKIVYTNTNFKEGGLWIMNSDGSNKRILTKLKR